jgi:hypothetical protein
MVSSLAVILPESIGCVNVYLPASVPDIVYPLAFIVIPVPTFLEAKVNTGEPPSETLSPPTTPDSEAVPVAEPAVVSSYTLLSPVNPVMVRVFLEVISLALNPTVS